VKCYSHANGPNVALHFQGNGSTRERAESAARWSARLFYMSMGADQDYVCEVYRCWRKDGGS
jgi:hypothetical protein